MVANQNYFIFAVLLFRNLGFSVVGLGIVSTSQVLNKRGRERTAREREV